MIQKLDSAERAGQAAQLRDAMVDELRADGVITSVGVEEAFRAVPRHEFVPPETPLDVAYSAYSAVVTKRDPAGGSVSSVSAPFTQVQMLEQADLRPGMRVLEIGSGGYSAALLAEVVGPGGYVVSIDIDPEVTARAAAALRATGYARRVCVLCADAEHGAPGAGAFDRIIVTVEAWDIARTWLDQLRSDGIIVVPLRINGVTRSISLHRDGDHLVSGTAEVCSVTAMQGVGAHTGQRILIPDAQGCHVTLEFDADVPDGSHLLQGVFETAPTEIWSGITITDGTPFADLHLWFATNLSGFCRLMTGAGAATDAQPDPSWVPSAVARSDSFAYLVARPSPDGAGIEVGVRAYGPDGEATAATMLEQIRTWHQGVRGGPAPTFGYWPTGSDHRRIPAGAAVVRKPNGIVAVSWPDPGAEEKPSPHAAAVCTGESFSAARPLRAGVRPGARRIAEIATTGTRRG
jgi:protein-L-isoaspartate(D-aspartate) O-methyltransferase